MRDLLNSFMKSPVGAVALICAVGLAAYWPSFAVPFVFDDIPNIVNNTDVHLGSLSVDELADALGSRVGGRRPLAYFSFALNYYVGGLVPWGYHLINLLIHILSAVVAAALAARIVQVSLPRWSSRARHLGLVTGLLFVSHPIQTQAVTYIVQRMASMAGLFALLATLCYLHATRARGRALTRWALGAGTCFALAALTKEHTWVLPGVWLIAIEVSIGGRLRAWMGSAISRWLLVAAAAVVASVVLGAQFWERILVGFGNRPFSMAERLLTEARVFWHYLSLVFWPDPARLRLDYSGFALSHGLFEPATTFLSIAAVVTVMAAGFVAIRRLPVAAFVIWWLLGTIMVESSILPLEIAFEHRMYLPVFGPLLGVSIALFAASSRARISVVWLVIPMVFALTAASFVRNAAWADSAAFHAAEASFAPDSVRPHLTLGWARHEAGDLDGAENAFRRALELEPTSGSIWNNLAVVARDRGHAAEAERLFRRSLALNGNSLEARQGLGRLLNLAGRYGEAEVQWNYLLEHHAKAVAGYVGMAAMHGMQGNASQARDFLNQAIALSPRLPYLWAQRAQTWMLEGNLSRARGDYEERLGLTPDDPVAHEELARCLAASGATRDAISSFDRVMTLDGGRRGIHYEVGNLLTGLGEIGAAEQRFLAEVALSPHSGAFNNLGNIALSVGDVGRARDFFSRALLVDPGNAAAANNLRRLPQ